MRVLRITPSYASSSNPGSGLNAYFHSKHSKFGSFILTENRGLEYLDTRLDIDLRAIRTFQSNLGEINGKYFVLRLFRKFISTLIFTLKSLFYIHSIKPNIVHIYSPIYLVTALHCKIFYKSKVVMTLHGTDGQRIRKYSSLKVIFVMVDVCLSMSKEVSTYFPEGRVRFLGNGYDKTIFRLRPDNIEVRRKYIVTVGNLRWQKNHINLIDAFQVFNSTNTNYKLLIVGEGELRNRLEKRIVQLGLEGNVILLGKKNQNYIARLMNVADFFVLSSVSEGFPKAVSEAMACGLPVLTTNVGDMKSTISSPLGLVVDSTVESLANGLNEMVLNGPFDRATIADSVGSKSWESVTKNLDKIYEGSV